MTRALLSLIVIAATAGEIPASWINAVTSDVETVTGIDVDRLRATGSHGASLVDIPFEGHRAIRYVMRIGSDVYLLRVTGDPFALAPRGRRFTKEGREVVDAGGERFLIRAQRETAIVGPLHRILWTVQLLECCPKHNSAIANLIAAYDAWIYQPNQPEFSGVDILFDAARLVPPMHNLRAGVRFGTTLHARVEVDAESAPKAAILAIAAKLTPTLLRSAGRIEAEFATAIEKFTATSNGNTVTAEMAVASSALRLLE